MPIWQEFWHHFQSGRKLDSKALKKVLLIDVISHLRFFFVFQKNLLDLSWALCHYCVTFLNNLPPILFQPSYRDSIKINLHNTPNWETKRGKIKCLPSPQQHLCPPGPYGSLPSQANGHAHTHFHTKHTHTQSTLVQPQSLLEREGDASKGSVWTMAETSPPHPAHLTLPWTNEAMISGFFIQVTIVQIHKVRDPFFCT